MLGRGDVLGGYRIDDVLGMGGMAIVYRAEQVSLGRQVALKVLSPELGRDEAFRERFRREGKHAAALHHPNVVTIFDSGEADGRLFIAMLLVDGRTLAERMSSGSLSAVEAVTVLGPVAQALDAAHAIGLIHRDVKPQNILLRRDGHPFVADFGVATTSVRSAGLTATGGFVGSVNYAAPEQIRGESITASVDIYAFTAVLYQCLTGQVPFRRDTDASVMFAHLNDPPPSLPVGTPYADSLNSILARGMAKRPQERPRLASDVIDPAERMVGDMTEADSRAAPAFTLANAASHQEEPATEPAQSPPTQIAKPRPGGPVDEPDSALVPSSESSERTTADRRRGEP